MWVGVEVEQLLDRAPLEELSLHRVETVHPIKVAPVVVGELSVAVVVLQAVGVVGLIVANVFPTAFAVGAYHVEFFVEPVGVAEDFIACGQGGGRDVFAEERSAIEFLVWRDPGEVKHRRPEVDEAHEAVGAVAALVVDEVFEIFRDTHDERDVQSAFVGVAFAAGHHAAVVAEVKNKRVLQ